MSRWLIKLCGDNFDLEEFPRWFPDGDIFSFEENGSVYLSGPAFESHEEFSKIQDMALQVIYEFSAVISLLCPGHRRPADFEVIKETDDGKHERYIPASTIATIRSKVKAVPVVGGQGLEELSITQGQVLLSGAIDNYHLRTALALWGDPIKTWPRLYRILEDIERYLGQHVNKSGLCSAKQRERFARSANCAEVSGKDARHAAGKFNSPNEPMILTEACGFISNILMETLNNAAK
ncbi:hypothetical protein RAN53_13905 [Halomonas sp. SSL-5]|uniref:hypothetical protein n=1 Tax=Halomonas sp. SSL-5 TaxID=3065855 RepID=UPI00273899CB|nr:hypothetical protein [Halomonas sp. SSL-5]MDY7117443.1 hypothetical protein [Halomonas sp. SSL-5]